MKIKRKYMDKSNWNRITKSTFIKEQSTFNNTNCIVGLLILDEITEPLTLNNNIGNYTIVDNGYKWLQIALENKNYWITAIFDKNNNLIQIYFDITNKNILAETPYFDDMFIDIILHKNKIYMVDQEELIQAYREGIITPLQYNKAKVVALELYDFIPSKKEEIIGYCYEMLEKLERKNKNGIKN